VGLFGDKDIIDRLNILEEQNKRLIKECEELRKSNEELKKKYDYVFSVEQRYEKNMNMCYENLKTEVRDNKKTMDSRHEFVNKKIDGNHNAVLNKARRLEKDIKYYYYKGLHPDQYPQNLKEWYKERTGEELNLENPTTFNEKVQWLKLYDSTEFKSRLADKYLVREFVKEKIGEEYLVPLIGVYDSFDDIDFDKLPEKFAMKTNHSSTWNLIVKDKAELDIEAAKRKFDYWLKRDYSFEYGMELHYSNIKPKIIIEKFIENFDEEVIDYRFFCFDGKVYAIWASIGSGTQNRKNNVYDLDWNLQPLKMGNLPNGTELEKRPDNLDKMIEISEKLSEGISMVRVDLYEINGKIQFGEMTFTPMSGCAKWNPPEYNKLYGEQIKLPN